MQKSAGIASIITLFLLIAIDGMSFGMTLPVLTPLLNKTAANILGNHASIEQRHIIYGIIMMLLPLAYFFGAPLVGYFSDRFGRKPILSLCLIGTFITYLFYVTSFSFNSLSLLIIARLLGGFTTGSQAVAQAAMSDISSNKTKVFNIGTIALAMTIGLVAGPFIGGVLSNHQYNAFFDNTTPFYFAALLSIINYFLLIFYLKETQCNNRIKLASFWQNVQQFLQRKTNIYILLVFFFFEMAWSMYYQGIAVTVAEAFHLQGIDIGYFSTYIGMSLSFGLIFILRLVGRHFSLQKIIGGSLIVGVVSLALGFFAKSLYAQIIIALPVTFMVATAYSSLITLLSNANSPDKQGLLMGISDSALSLAFAITGFLSGWLTIYNPMLPLLSAAIFMLAASILFFTNNYWPWTKEKPRSPSKV